MKKMNKLFAVTFLTGVFMLGISNILKRNNRNDKADTEPAALIIGDYILDSDRLTLTLGDQSQNVTKRESELIQYLFNNKNEVVKREQILANVWGSSDFFSGRSMDVFISRLRKYFKDDSTISIESKRGVGLEFRLG